MEGRDPSRLLAAVLLLGIALSAVPSVAVKELPDLARLEAKVKKRKSGYWLKTRHWRINTTVDERFTAELGLFMERFWLVFSELISGEAVVAVRPTVVILPDRKTYRKKVDDSSRGWFRWRTAGTGEFVEFHLYTYINGRKQRDFARFPKGILLHEGTHALLQLYLGTLSSPPWFNEGLAEYFEVWDLTRDPVENRRLCRAQAARELSWHRAPLLSVRELSAMTQQQWNDEPILTVRMQNYATAATFIDFLLSAPERKQLLVTAFDRIWEGVDPHRLFTEAEIRSLEPQWRAHVDLLIEDLR